MRHASVTVAAQAGVTTRELMTRAGHRTTAAAMVYQHVAEERSAGLAVQMDALTLGAEGDRRLSATQPRKRKGPENRAFS